MSLIYLEMVRNGNMTEGDVVVLYAAVTVLTRHGLPVKTILAQLVRMLPAHHIPQFEDEVKAVITRMHDGEIPT